MHANIRNQYGNFPFGKFGYGTFQEFAERHGLQVYAEHIPINGTEMHKNGIDPRSTVGIDPRPTTSPRSTTSIEQFNTYLGEIDQAFFHASGKGKGGKKGKGKSGRPGPYAELEGRWL